MTNSITPVHGHVLLEKMQQNDKTHFGVIIPEGVKGKPVVARVKFVGDNSSLSPGDVVAFPAKIGHIVKHDGVEYVSIIEKEILLTL